MEEHTPFGWFNGLPLPSQITTALLVAALLLTFALSVRRKLVATESALIRY